MSTAFIVTPREGRAAPLPALGSLAPYLADPSVTDVFVNGRGGLFVDHGSGALACPEWRASEREVRQLATALIAAGNRHVDDAHPCVDVRLPGGLRVHVVLAPISTTGTAISIRVARPGVSTFEDLLALGAADEDVAVFLQEAVARRANFLVSGAAGVGKTTLLAALLALAPATERIVTIEDVAELVIDHPHHVALEARQPNLEGAGAVSLARLVREALRMKPDRLVIGECRGGEVRELLTALNTGHDGGAGTVHANSLADVATRLEALGALAGLDDAALARQVTSAMEFVVHLERDRDGTRRIAAVGEFRIEDGRLRVVQRAHGAVPGSRRAKRVSADPAPSASPAGRSPGDSTAADPGVPTYESTSVAAASDGPALPRTPVDGPADHASSRRRVERSVAGGADGIPGGSRRPHSGAPHAYGRNAPTSEDDARPVSPVAPASVPMRWSSAPTPPAVWPVASTPLPTAGSSAPSACASPVGETPALTQWSAEPAPPAVSSAASTPVPTPGSSAAVAPVARHVAPTAVSAPRAPATGAPDPTLPAEPASAPTIPVAAVPVGASERPSLLPQRAGFVPARRIPEVPRAAA